MAKRETPLYTLSRAKILSIIKKNPNIRKDELSKKMGLSKTSIYHHLEELEKRKLIIETPDKKKLGCPISLNISNTADPVPLGILELFEKVFPSLFK